jgi:hypothetical protein
MKEMANDQLTTDVQEAALERAVRIRSYIEEMILTVGEHPECELKKTWSRESPYHRAEMVKDIQATANSAIAPEKEKFIVVGADQETRTITGCNPGDYDDAAIRQLVEQYLDPVPSFEVLAVKSSTNTDFVVLRFPSQQRRPIVVKREIRGEKNQVHLAVGQVWIKPGGSETGGTGKRLVTSRQELVDMIDIAPRLNNEVEARIQQLLPQIRLEERTRLGGGQDMVLPIFTATDEEFESYIEQLLVGEKVNHLHVALEKLRDRTVLCWQGHFGEDGRITTQQISEIKEAEFLPAMRRLVLLGMLLIKFSAPLQWFDAIVNLLVEVFESSHSLRWAQSPPAQRQSAPSLADHQSFTVPALEALLAVYVLGSYALVIRERTQYLRALFPRIVKAVGGPDESEPKSFLLFWPLTYEWGTPNIRRDMLVVERYARGDRIESLMGNSARIKEAVLQLDCLVDWHAVLAQRPDQGEPETNKFFESKYAGIDDWYVQNFTIESLRNVAPLARRLWDGLLSRRDHLFLDSDLAEIVNGYDPDRRKRVLAKFLAYAEREQARVMWAQQRYPFMVQWDPPELDTLVKEVKTQTNR